MAKGKKKTLSKRNPIAKAVRHLRAKVVPDKRRAAQEKAKKRELEE